ncbi:MAG TPA: isocitrate lyase/phosphoenolpyruvate mutase family protein [Bryobacteraceae bacterium]|nr:isocitrate lyase/phosphoenolpyruvate mutase family protein [Bryobacteraceae bacterium]
MTQAEKATKFRELHHSGKTLVLPNAWDVGSALVFEKAGFPAIATTSAGVAAVFGYPDGEQISPDLMLDMVRRIAQAVTVPVTADVEGGYDDAVKTALAVMEAGAVGINLEDTLSAAPDKLVDLSKHTEMIRGVRRETNVVVNARCDIYLNRIGEAGSRFEQTVERAGAYHAAGADAVFIPGVVDRDTIGRLVKAIGGPINILALSGVPPIPELQELGVARVSIGSGGARAALGLARRLANELRDHGTFTSMTADPLSFPELQLLLRGSASAVPNP